MKRLSGTTKEASETAATMLRMFGPEAEHIAEKRTNSRLIIGDIMDALHWQAVVAFIQDAGVVDGVSE